MTRRSLKPDQALLVGKLFIYERRGPWTRPVLGIEVYCPFCHDRLHVHGWFAEERSGTVSHRSAHCPAGPLRERGYFIGLDPTHKAANRATLDEFRREEAEWQARYGAMSAPA